MPFTTTPLVLTAEQLLDLETRVRSGRAAHDCRPSVATCRAAPASTRAVHAVDRPRVRDEGRGCDRPVPRSAPARRGLLHRRKDGDSSARSAGPGPAVVARTRRTARLRVLPTLDALALCRAEQPNGRSGGPHRESATQR